MERPYHALKTCTNPVGEQLLVHFLNRVSGPFFFFFFFFFLNISLKSLTNFKTYKSNISHVIHMS